MKKIVLVALMAFGAVSVSLAKYPPNPDGEKRDEFWSPYSKIDCEYKAREKRADCEAANKKGGNMDCNEVESSFKDDCMKQLKNQPHWSA